MNVVGYLLMGSSVVGSAICYSKQGVPGTGGARVNGRISTSPEGGPPQWNRLLLPGGLKGRGHKTSRENTVVVPTSETPTRGGGLQSLDLTDRGNVTHSGVPGFRSQNLLLRVPLHFPEDGIHFKSTISDLG